MLTFDEEQLQDCIKNIESVADIESGHTYMIFLSDKITNEEFHELGEFIVETLNSLHIKCIVFPSSSIDKVYEIKSVGHK